MIGRPGATQVIVAAILAAAPLSACAGQGAPAAGPAGQGATPASALPDTVIEARTTAIASQLRCPVCQGLSIQDSPSELSQQMRALVREQVAAGRTDDEIRAYFVSKYGEWILLAPRARGFNLLAYMLPLALLLGGGAIVALSVRRWAAAPADAADASVATADPGDPGAERHPKTD